MTTNKGDRIKNLRINNKMTLEEVGEKIGVSKQTLYKYENNIITNIPSDKIEGLARVFNISPAVIMGWDKDDDTTKIKKLQSMLKYCTHAQKCVYCFPHQERSLKRKCKKW